jgi:hypothetical protein
VVFRGALKQATGVFSFLQLDNDKPIKMAAIKNIFFIEFNFVFL